MSKNQRKLAKNLEDKRPEISSQLRQWIQETQNCLKIGDFEQAVQLAQKIEWRLKDDSQNAGIYLTSILWQIRALQSMNRIPELDDRIETYISQSVQKQVYAHQIQGYRLKAQRLIDQSLWQEAIETLTKALEPAMESFDGRNVVELLMHISALEIKLGFYRDGMEHLARGLMVVDNSGLPDDEIREMKAIGQRQLAELFDKTGDGQAACQALDAAMSVKCSDIEEQWLQQILLSHFDMRIGNANAAQQKLESVKTDILRQDPDKYRSQLEMVELEMAQVCRALGKYKEATARLDNIESSSVSIQKAILLTKYQWAIENGKPESDPDIALKQFNDVELPDEAGDRPLIWASELATAALDRMRGNFDTAYESLQYISEKAAFAQLIPISTKARLMMSEIEFRQKKYEQSACHAREVTEDFIQHVDDVSAKCAAILMLRAQYEVYLIQSGGDTVMLDKAENASFIQLCEDCERYRKNGHIEAFLDLGLPLAMLSHRMGDVPKCMELAEQLKNYIQPEFMAYRAVQYNYLMSQLDHDDSWIQNAENLVSINGFVL